ncbi:hypothetical protein EVAR_9121_1 [Eumeta japonica]|uniref:Uncharacterized protein n=1 Tax=Eumeta variegata TaxID=151549 RepID=A0A4C1TWH5_EUMVA|nr:hypothetical protein EVAR_9121_1 [Eumeta japonica]
MVFVIVHLEVARRRAGGYVTCAREPAGAARQRRGVGSRRCFASDIRIPCIDGANYDIAFGRYGKYKSTYMSYVCDDYNLDLTCTVTIFTTCSSRQSNLTMDASNLKYTNHSTDEPPLEYSLLDPLAAIAVPGRTTGTTRAAFKHPDVPLSSVLWMITLICASRGRAAAGRRSGQRCIPSFIFNVDRPYFQSGPALGSDPDRILDFDLSIILKFDPGSTFDSDPD